MYTLEKDFKCEYAHRLMFHKGDCKNLHGHSAKIKLELSAKELNDNGMIIDFGHLGFIKDYFRENYDHTLILNENDPLYEIIKSAEVCKDFKMRKFVGEPTSENFAKAMAYDIIAMITERNIPITGLKITFWETAKNSASYTLSKPFV